MADYGHDLLFGTFLTPVADQAQEVVELARLSDRVGLDLVSVQDHPYQPAFLDTWTLLSVIAATTSRVRVFPNVANLPLRPPAVLAGAVASLDILSGGRAELGLGAGGFWQAIAALGGPRRTPGVAVEALDEAVQVIRALWTPGPGVRLDGAHYSLDGAKPGPFPLHDIGIWLGAIKPRMLALTGRAADGWLPSAAYVTPDQLTARNRIIDDAATEAGRKPGDVRRLYNIGGEFGTTTRGFLQGPPRTWAEQLAELTLTEGVSAYILASGSAHDIQRFAQEVAPAVRELVEHERAGPAVAGSVERERADPAAAGSVERERAGPAVAGPVERERADPAAAGLVERERADWVAGGRIGRFGQPKGLGIETTPPPAVRLSDERLWDEAGRPQGPPPAKDRKYTPHERAAGRHLIDVHDHLRGELTQIRDVIEQVAAGSMAPGIARSHINTMTMRQNNWTLGTYCESFCRVVTNHHMAEDQMVFPQLRRADKRLAPVIDRLEEEHLVIQDVLERVDRALVALVSEPDGIKELSAAVDLLTDTLLSHLSYEERELVEPLSRLL